MDMAGNLCCPEYAPSSYLRQGDNPHGLSIPEKSINKIKIRISRLINIYLINYLKVGFEKSRCEISPKIYDWDLLGLIYEVRNYLYGGLSEAHLKSFIEKGNRLPKMRGLMGFYCLLDNPKQLKDLDGWILSALRRAMAARNVILKEKYGKSCPLPSNKALATGSWLSMEAWSGDDFPEPRAPSLMRGWRAARKHFFTFGLEQVSPPGYYSDGFEF